MTDHANRIESFQSTQLNARDFDNTEALTMHPSPNNVDVNSAYTVAVDEVLGPNALSQYVAAGGLRNRNPRQVVAALLPDEWPERIDKLACSLTAVKLEVLEAEIGRHATGVWPQLSDGFAEFKLGLEAAKDDGVLIDDSVVSSGHTSFIKRVYEFWGLPEPDIFVTTETTHQNIPPYTADQLTKPSWGLIALTHELWQRRHGLDGVMLSEFEASRIVGVGDDAVKDGEMFSGVGSERFHLITPETARAVWWAVSKDLGIDQFVSKITYV